MGGQLVHRTSRHVALTPLGERFLADVRPAYERLATTLERAHRANRLLDGTLRLGIYFLVAGGPHLATIIGTFETRYPGCQVHVSDLPTLKPLDPLRRGDIDVMAMRLPLEQPDLVIGPILSREPRVLAVGQSHPLAGRTQVSVEDVADYLVLPLTEEPRETIRALIPHHTPGGRPIRRLRRAATSPYQVAELIAREKIVHPTVPSAAQYIGHNGIVYIPIQGLEPSRTALVWRRGSNDPRLREFVRTARELLRAARARTTRHD